MPGAERVILTLETGREFGSYGGSHATFLPYAGEDVQEAARRVATDLSGKDLNTHFHAIGMPPNQGVRLTDKSEIRAQVQRQIVGHPVAVGSFSLWRTVERIPFTEN